MTWEEICHDPVLRDLPFKIEQDRYGRVVMSPPPETNHAEYDGEIIRMVSRLLPDWVVLGECGIETTEGVKVPDVCVMSRSRRRNTRGLVSFKEAPEICIEVLSPSNSPEEMDEKRRLYAAKGCTEFWTCSESGEMSFYDAPTGERLAASALCVGFPMRIVLD